MQRHWLDSQWMLVQHGPFHADVRISQGWHSSGKARYLRRASDSEKAGILPSLPTQTYKLLCYSSTLGGLHPHQSKLFILMYTVDMEKMLESLRAVRKELNTLLYHAKASSYGITEWGEIGRYAE